MYSTKHKVDQTHLEIASGMQASAAKKYFVGDSFGIKVFRVLILSSLFLPPVAQQLLGIQFSNLSKKKSSGLFLRGDLL